MAPISRSHKDTAKEVLNILNDGIVASPSASDNRKTPGEPARRRVGRPAKRSKTSAGATIRVDSGAGGSNGRILASTGSVRAQDRPGIAAEEDSIYAIPPTPQAVSKSRRSPVGQTDSDFSLHHGAFDALAQTTEAKNALHTSPSRATRSRVKLANEAEKELWKHQDLPARQQRRLRPNPFHDDTVDEGSFETTGQMTRPARLRSLQVGGNVTPSEQNAMENANIGYPSPESRSTARKRPASVIENQSLTAATRSQTAGGSARKSPGSADDDQSSAGRESESNGGTDQDNGDEANDDGVDANENSGEEEEGEGEEVDSHEETEEQETASGRTSQGMNRRQSAPPPKFAPRFEAAANLNNCGRYWSTARSAARSIRERGDPSTKQVQRLCVLIKASKDELRESVHKSPEVDALDEFDDTALQKVATAMGNLKNEDSQPGRQAKCLARDIYLHAIPQAVELLCCILIVRAARGTLDQSGLEELNMILKATCSLCERISKWKPKPTLTDKVKSRTNNEIKLSLRPIKEEYDMALSDLEAADSAERAADQADEHAERMARQYDAHLRDIEEKRGIITMAVARQRQAAQVQRQQLMQQRQSVQQRNVIVLRDKEVYDVDDGCNEHCTDQDETILPASSRFVREATEDIPEPTKRPWQKEETMALLLLLQRHRGPDRYLRIHECIQEISRDIRKLGADKFLAMADQGSLDIDLDGAADTLDDLGAMEVTDIEQQAQYLKASQSLQMERDSRTNGNSEAWEWLSGV